MLGAILKMFKLLAKFIMVMNTLGLLDDMMNTINDTINSFEETTVPETTTAESTTL